MLLSSLATVTSLAGLALAAPATVDRSADLAKRGNYKYDERAIHKVTVGKSGSIFRRHPQARASCGTTPSSSTRRRATSSCKSGTGHICHMAEQVLLILIRFRLPGSRSSP